MHGTRRLFAAVAMASLALAGCKKDKDPSTEATGTAENGSAKSGAANAAQKPADQKPAEEAKAPEGCNSDFSQAIKVDYTLTKKCSPYTLADGQTLTVDGWYLTIEPGVEVRFGENAHLEVGYNQKGRLIAQGTAEAPITFTSAKRKEPGYWGGIRLNDNAGGSVIDHAVLEYGGTTDRAALVANGPDIKLNHIKFVGIAGRAVKSEQGLSEFSGNDLRDSGVNGIAMEVNTESLGAFKPDNQFPDKSVIAFDGDVHKSLTVGPAGAPYRLVEQQVTIESPDQGDTPVMTINAGVTIQNAEGARWVVGYNRPGTLVMKGTEQAPVVFTSALSEPEKGSWRGILLETPAKPLVMDHARIEYAGESPDGAAVAYKDAKKLGEITHSTFAHIAGAAIRAESDSSELWTALSDDTFEDVDGPLMSLNIALANKLSAQNTFPKDGFIRLVGSELKRDTTLAALPVPYRVDEQVTVENDDPNKASTLTIEPGALVEFSPGIRITVGYNNPGRLVAKGATDKPITFTAASEPWGGIRLTGVGTAELENAVIAKVAADHGGFEVDEKSKGSLKNVKFQDMDVGARLCGFKAEGLKGERVKTLEKKDDC